MPKRKLVKFTIHKIGKIKKSRFRENKCKSLFFTPEVIRYFKYAGIAVVTIALMAFVYFNEQAGVWFKASVLEAPQPFNGTSMPVGKVPDWTNWSGDNHTTVYLEVDKFVNLPNYDLNKMAFPNNDLIWGNPDHDIIRNTKITYPVVYMGNYQLDHKEYSGSHPAIDIKMPVGTPLHTIANGKVVKTSTQSSGFGHHVVIQHPNAPDPNGGTTTLYSCYVHMDQVSVVEGQNVLKGDAIGTSGNTGTSTTPHLHFQIDRDSAPWHPYWPFSWSDSQAAGFSFFEAVNAGLGTENAMTHTINPINYVTKYLGAYSLASTDSGSIDNTPDNSDNSTDNQDSESTDGQENTSGGDEDLPVNVIDNPVNDGSQIDTSLFIFNLIGESTSLLNNGVTITAIDESNQISQLDDNDEIRVELSGVGQLMKKTFRKSDFNNNAIKIVVNSSGVGTANVLIGKSSHQINFIEKATGIASLGIEHDGHFQKNTVEVVKIIALDVNGNKTPAVNFGGTISVTVKEGQATITPDRLAVNDFQNGEATVRVTSSSENRVIIRAQNGALVGESNSLTAEDKTVFTDVGRGHENYIAIKYLSDNDIINGYDDGTFKPDKTVNRVEALKMLMLAFSVGTGPAQQLTFSDTDSNAWYATALGTAVAKGIVKGYDDGTFRPGSTVNKAEYLKMLFETNGVDLTDSVTANPYADVPKDAWYAPYAYLTNRKNLMEVADNLLKAADGMTRGDVAETIYRFKYVLDNNLVTYSR
jgi:murein DD-endopeptidase MepM/ murein hydrolase activator NlpD